MTVDEARIAKELRRDLELDDYWSDREILETTKGSYTRGRVELRLALQDLGAAFKATLPAVIRRRLP